MKKAPQPDKRQRSLLQFFSKPNDGNTDLEPAGEPAKDAVCAIPDHKPPVAMAVDAENAAPNAEEEAPAPPAPPPPSPPSATAPAQQEALEPSPPVEEAHAASASAEEDEEVDEAPPAEPVPAPAAAPAPLGRGGLTEYELEREKRIRRNAEVMRSLGLGVGGAASLPLADGAAAKARRRGGGAQRKRPKDNVPAEPLRKSRRLQGGATGGGADTGGAAAPAAQEPEEEEDELQFDDSSVQRYVCEVLAAPGGGDGGVTERWDGPPPSGAAIRGFSRLPGLLVDPALARAYSVDWRPGLVAAGGKDGHAAVWGSAGLEAGDGDGDTEILPLLSYKLHKGWISDVQLWGGGGGAGEVLLLSAANDGVVALWDVGKSAERALGGRTAHNAMPKPLARTDDLHAGGIFSMHAAAGRVATGSKDCSVVVSTVDSGAGAFSVVRRYDDLHDGVVKCVRWRPDGSGGGGGSAEVFASCGNDRAVRVVDVREGPASGSGLVIEDAHATAINCLRWSPGDAHLILTASNDPSLLLHDLRSPAQSLHTFLGHVTKPRAKGIYQPAFVAGGAAVAAAADPSDRLSLYSVADGRTVSRGEVDLAVGATAAGAGPCAPLLVTANRCVALLAPRWEAAGRQF